MSPRPVATKQLTIWVQLDHIKHIVGVVGSSIPPTLHVPYIAKLFTQANCPCVLFHLYSKTGKEKKKEHGEVSPRGCTIEKN